MRATACYVRELVPSCTVAHEVNEEGLHHRRCSRVSECIMYSTLPGTLINQYPTPHTTPSTIISCTTNNHELKSYRIFIDDGELVLLRERKVP